MALSMKALRFEWTMAVDGIWSFAPQPHAPHEAGSMSPYLRGRAQSRGGKSYARRNQEIAYLSELRRFTRAIPPGTAGLTGPSRAKRRNFRS